MHSVYNENEIQIKQPIWFRKSIIVANPVDKYSLSHIQNYY